MHGHASAEAQRQQQSLSSSVQMPRSARAVVAPWVFGESTAFLGAGEVVTRVAQRAMRVIHHFMVVVGFEEEKGNLMFNCYCDELESSRFQNF